MKRRTVSAGCHTLCATLTQANAADVYGPATNAWSTAAPTPKAS